MFYYDFLRVLWNITFHAQTNDLDNSFCTTRNSCNAREIVVGLWSENSKGALRVTEYLSGSEM